MQYKHFDRVKVPRYIVGRNKYQGNKLPLISDIVNEALPVFHTLLEFSNDLMVALKPMGKHVIGMYDPNVDVAEVEYRDRDVFSTISTLAHELVHAEQYYQKRFDSEWCGSGYIYRWNNTYYCFADNDYSKQMPPWEQEAFERQDGLALIVCAELGV